MFFKRSSEQGLSSGLLLPLFLFFNFLTPGELMIKSRKLGSSCPAERAPLKKSLIDWKYITSVADILLSTSAGWTPSNAHEKDLMPAPGALPTVPSKIFWMSFCVRKLGIFKSFSIDLPFSSNLIFPTLSYSRRDILRNGVKRP